MDFMLVVFEYGKIMFFEGSSHEEEVIEKVDNYAELTVPLMVDQQFKQNFRLSTTTFEYSLGKCYYMLQQNDFDHTGFPRTTTEKELMTTIWYLGNMESLRSVAERFGVTKSTCWDVVYRTCNLLLKINQVYKIISWPHREKQQENRNNFSRHDFTDVYAGEAGSIHDDTLLGRSDLYQRIMNGQINLYDDSHMVGVLAYRISTSLLTASKRNRQLIPREHNYNVILSKARVKIENAFALLKGRFRRIKYLETKRLDLAALLIISSCVLHNLCIVNNDLIDGLIKKIKFNKKYIY